MSKKEEFCIMKDNPPLWSNKRFAGSHRHEVMFGTANRKKSIEDGLVIFLRPEDHNASKYGIHFNKDFDLYAKKEAEKRWCEFYNKTPEQFRKRYGRNYL